jgi:hypothetical protein
MQYFAMTTEEKNELCKKGLKCLGCHRIFIDKIPTGAVKWEFDMPDEPIKEEIKDTVIPPNEIAGKQEVLEEKEPPKKRGNPNWLKRKK